MSDPSITVKKAARTFDLQAMMEQARSGAQERTKIDWTNEIERAKDENETRIAEMKLKADEAAKKLQISTNSNNINEDDDDDDDFGPSIDLATASTADNGDSSSDEEDKNQSQVEYKLFFLTSAQVNQSDQSTESDRNSGG
jgi:hypothetical protein